MRQVFFLLVGAVTFAVLALAFLARLNLSAVREPGRLEQRLGSRLKHYRIARSSRGGIPLPPADMETNMSISQGRTLYVQECAMCHGTDGRTPTDMGRLMYPESPDLHSPEVQSYSDRELFWIIKNGIRFSGMPAMSKTETDEHIWNLVDYVRSIR
jgi:mono/diheme cytochrome c family protein